MTLTPGLLVTSWSALWTCSPRRRSQLEEALHVLVLAGFERLPRLIDPTVVGDGLCDHGELAHDAVIRRAPLAFLTWNLSSIDSDVDTPVALNTKRLQAFRLNPPSDRRPTNLVTSRSFLNRDQHSVVLAALAVEVYVAGSDLALNAKTCEHALLEQLPDSLTADLHATLVVWWGVVGLNH